MNDRWYFAQDGQQRGPITLDGLRQQIAAGAVQSDTLVWLEGMADWIEARRVPELAQALGVSDRGAYDLSPESAAPAAAAAPVPMAGSYAAGPYAAGPYAGAPYPGQVLGYGTYQQQPGWAYVIYAGFWIRFVAAFIDGLITAVPGFCIGFVGEIMAQSQGTSVETSLAFNLGTNAVSLIIGWLYEAMFTSSSYQATPGKMVVGIKVTDLNGNPISFGRATGRHFAKIISGLICAIGYIMAAFDERKRALHDQMAGTLVVYK